MKLPVSIAALFISCVMFANQPIRMAVTVDDLPTHGNLPPTVTREQIAQEMLAVFKKHKIKEVYGFINSGRDDGQGELSSVFKLWHEAGYPLGNHTYTHISLNKSAAEVFKSEVVQNEETLKKWNEGLDWKFLRYPYLHEGDTVEKRNSIREFLKQRGYQIAQVTVDFEDWSWNDPYARCVIKNNSNKIRWLEKTYLENASDILDRAEKSTQIAFQKRVAHVLLLHIGAFDARMLDRLLSLYEKKGVHFVSLAEAQSDSVYRMDPGLTYDHGTELQYQFLKSQGKNLDELGLGRYLGYPQNELDRVCR